MFTLLFIITPIFFVVAGTLAALTLSTSEETSEPTRTDIRVPDAPMFRAGLNLDLEVGQPTLTPEEALVAMEAHLRRERLAAATFARNPSHETLWMN